MAQAIQHLYPEAKFAIGPAIDNGFYYDVDLPQTLGPDDLPRIEAEMKKIIKEDLPLERFELDPDEAKKLMAGKASGLQAGADRRTFRQGRAHQLLPAGRLHRSVRRGRT